MIFGKRELIIAIIISFAVGFSIGFLVKGKSMDKKGAEEIIISNSEDEGIYVHIAGEVKNPGVYEMKKGDRVFNVIERAGGPTDKADLDSINLAEKLRDGEKIIVYAKRENISGKDGNNFQIEGSAVEKRGNLININTASKEELKSLPGIGDVLAQRIIDYRNSNGYFKSIEEIKEVSGIGEKRFEAIKDLITIGP